MRSAGTLRFALLERGTDFLRGVGWDHMYPNQQSVARILGEFALVSAHAGDFAALVLFHEQGGLIFAASSVWSGSGGIYYPADPLDNAIYPSGELAPPPVQLQRVGTQPNALMRSMRHLNAVHDLAKQTYRAAIFPYSREMQPGFDNVWVVLLIRAGTC